MFFETERLPHVQRMILAKDEPTVVAECLAALLPYQRADFDGLFRAMDGLPVIVRLIDPPLHEFLPGHVERGAARSTQLAEPRGPRRSDSRSGGALLAAIERLHEANPMLGLRGVRLGIHLAGAHPHAGAGDLRGGLRRRPSDGVDVHPEVMIPLAGHWRELEVQQAALRGRGRAGDGRAGAARWTTSSAP